MNSLNKLKKRANLPFGTIKPPIKNMISSEADAIVFEITKSRAIEAIDRKRPIPIWCTTKSKNMKRKNLEHLKGDISRINNLT